jgi:hypothetical protein
MTIRDLTQLNRSRRLCKSFAFNSLTQQRRLSQANERWGENALMLVAELFCYLFLLLRSLSVY